MEMQVNTTELRSNWRLQMLLYRAYFDAHVQARYQFEQMQQRAAYGVFMYLTGLHACTDPWMLLGFTMVLKLKPSMRVIQYHYPELCHTPLNELKPSMRVIKYHSVLVSLP
jgi:hypothetical protein